MRIFAMIFVIAIAIAVTTPASAVGVFHTHWKDHYLSGNKNPLFVKTAKKAGCFICHVKGEKKEDARNEYGEALGKHLKAADFPKAWVKNNPDEAKKRIVAAFEKVEDELSRDGDGFGRKISKGQLPAVDAGL